MPEVASVYTNTRNIQKAQSIQDQILRAYELDFVMHANHTTSANIQQVWASIPSQLAKENKKFIYRVIRSGARARQYEEAIQWLAQAGLAYKAARTEKPAIPLNAYEDVSAFKLYLFDTGLLMRMARLEPKSFAKDSDLFTGFKGSLAENIVAASLIKSLNQPLVYWVSEGIAKVDFLTQFQEKIIPIEVKSGTQTKAKSLATYQKKYNPELRVRISKLNIDQTDDLLNIPLYYSGTIRSWIEKGLQ